MLEIEIKHFKEFIYNLSSSVFSFKPVEYLPCETVWAYVTRVIAACNAAPPINIFYEFLFSEFFCNSNVFLKKPCKNFIAYTIRAKRVEYPLIADDAQAIVKFLNHFKKPMHKQAMNNSLLVAMTIDGWHSCSYPENSKRTTNPSFV